MKAQVVSHLTMDQEVLILILTVSWAFYFIFPNSLNQWWALEQVPHEGDAMLILNFFIFLFLLVRFFQQPDSNPGQLGAKRERCRCAMPSPL